MSASVFAFPSRNTGPQPWTNDELAELYRVVEILGRAGLAVDTDMGMTDEGDPWFVFCRRDSGDVIAHFARIGGQFVAASVAVDETYRGANFRQIVERMVESQPLIVPPPGSGTRLLTHPIVILTAFVATALAHSEKLLATDSLRAVDAQWDHHHVAGDASAARHGKIGWLDSLHALLKSAVLPDKAAYDGISKEGQALTLASLIAIAMSALQPVVDKVAAITHTVIDDLSGHSNGAPASGGSHAAQLALDLPVVDGGQGADGTVMTVAPNSDDSPQSHKLAAADLGGDAQKVLIDLSSHAGAPAIVKALAADDVSHTAAAPSVDSQGDAGNSSYVLLQQKAANAAVAIAELAHSDSAAAAPSVITIDQITPQALQALHIARGGGDAASASNPASIGAADGSNSDASQTTGVVPPISPNDQIIDVTDTSGTTVVNAISNFATSNTHVIAQPFTESVALQQDLQPYFGSSSSLKVVVFESNTVMPEVFAFSPGVVFVDEKLLSGAQLSNHGGNLVLDVTGGTVTLVGVMTVGSLVA